jgi:hypothetical protein
MLARLALSTTMLLAACGLIGCDDDAIDEDLLQEARPFVDGVAKDTDGGAFRIVLSSHDGALEVGENQLAVRVGFHDPDDPHDPGKGIPGANIELIAWMPLDDGRVEQQLAIEYEGDGEYRLAPIELDRAGIWQLDLDIAVGATIRETVSFAFVVE